VLRETVGHIRDLPRYRQILATLIRYGYHDLVTALHLEGLVRPIERAAMGADVPHQDRAVRLRMVLEELGPTTVKLGQLLSTRPDLVPEPFLVELTKLRDDVRPFPFEAAYAILTEEYGRPPEELFAAIDPVPVASASISQVHRATTRDGRTLALKIRRPDIERVVQADLDILRNLSQLAERRLPMLAPYAPAALAREFERTLKRELDFSVERRTMERCRRQLERLPFAHVPAVDRALSTPHVLAMEFVGGAKVDDLEGLRRMGVDPVDVADRGAAILLTQIFRYGFFHADPHPGNLRVLPGGIVAPLDYGMFGQIDRAVRERIADLLLGLLAQDVDKVLRALDALDIRGETVDPRALRRDVAELVSTYTELNLDAIDLARLLGDLVELVRGHQLRIPPDLVLLIRTLVTIEGVGRHLDPHFDIAAKLGPFVRDLTARRFSPWRMMAKASRTAEDLQRITTLLPELLGRSLESIDRGELIVRLDVQNFDHLVRQLARAGNALALGIVIAGLLVGSSLLVHSNGSSTLGYGGYVAALTLTIWMVWHMATRERL